MVFRIVIDEEGDLTIITAPYFCIEHKVNYCMILIYNINSTKDCKVPY